MMTVRKSKLSAASGWRAERNAGYPVEVQLMKRRLESILRRRTTLFRGKSAGEFSPWLDSAAEQKLLEAGRSCEILGWSWPRNSAALVWPAFGGAGRAGAVERGLKQICVRSNVVRAESINHERLGYARVKTQPPTESGLINIRTTNEKSKGV